MCRFLPIDLIAIPDFVSGAMEHWGLVTFRETALLFDPLESSTSNKKRVATVVAHELAHQWFGNLSNLVRDIFFGELVFNRIIFYCSDHNLVGRSLVSFFFCSVCQNMLERRFNIFF